MCLIVDEIYRDLYTAKVPIEVFKILREDDNASPFMTYQYEPGTTVRTDPLEVLKQSRAVNDGLHAFRCYNRALCFSLSLAYRGYKVVKMTIPVGGHYYIGEENEIASDVLETGTLEACSA